MANIEERVDSKGRARYRVQVRHKGYPAQTATFDRKTDAKEWARQTEADMKAGRYFRVAEAKRHTAADMIDRYLRQVMPSKRPNSRALQTGELLWWRARFGDLALADVTTSLIVEARDELALGMTRSKRPRLPSTVNRYLAILGHCFSIAVREWGWIDDTPMRKVTKPKEPHGRVRFLSDDERERLLAACGGSKNLYLYSIVVLAISTGMRRNEIMNLTWDRVDLQRCTITLLPEDTKTSESRRVTLVGRALHALRELSKTRRIDTPLVFPAPYEHGRRPRPIDIQSAWRVSLRRAGIEDFHFRDLRHTAASYLAMNGATLAEIAEVLGHKTLQMVKRYAHLTETHTSKVVARMNTAVFGETQVSPKATEDRTG